jgi:curli biogenesis system outer membrane secretion channel CsgG
MNKSLIAAFAAAMAFAALPALASTISASANGQPAMTSGLSTGTIVAQSNDNQSDSNSSSSQSDDGK